MKKLLFLSFLICYSLASFAQSVEITPGNILPQVTTAQRNAIASPKNGMLVFDTNTQSYWFRQSGSWTELPKGGSTANYWQLTGNTIKNTNSGGFWSENPVGLTGLATITTNPPTAPVSGDGTRMMWIPSRSAFRVGTVADNAKSWDADSIGIFSMAMGYNTTATRFNSFAIGNNTTATRTYSFAIGNNTKATGTYSFAIGNITTASGDYSTAMGTRTTASAFYSTAMGGGTVASGESSTAMGYFTTASGTYSTAIGRYSTASGYQSTAMGSNVNASAKGTFFIGDSRTTDRPPVNWDDQFLAAFYHGYVLKTRNGGVSIGGGQTAWNSLSDSTKKENFLKANGEEFLTKLSKLKLGSWNYKGNENRNYGPMAQEIFTAFGQDKLGTIGSDTMVNTLDMDGLLFIFAQALEERTEALKHELQLAKTNMGQLRDEISKLKVENVLQKSESEMLKNDISLMKEQLKVLSEHFTSSENRVPQRSE